MSRPASSFANPQAEEQRRSSSSSGSRPRRPASAPTGTDPVVGGYLSDNPTLPTDSVTGMSSTYWNQSVNRAGLGSATPGYTSSPDNYLRWIKSRYTPDMARATTAGEALGTLISDPASYALAVRAARQWYSGYSNFDPQWAEGFFREDVIPSAIAMGVSPFELLNRIASGAVTSLPGGAPGGGGSYGGGGYGGGSSTQMTIDLSSPQQARGLIMQTIQGVLGRDPSDDEYNQFVTVLNEAQTANPQVVTASGDTVTRSGGIDAGLLALDYAQSRDDYEDVQANQYYNMFLDVLAGG